MGLLNDFFGDAETKDEYGVTERERRAPVWSGLLQSGAMLMAAGQRMTDSERAQYLAKAFDPIARVPEQMRQQQGDWVKQKLAGQEGKLKEQQIKASQFKLDEESKWRAYADSAEFQAAMDSANATPAERMAAKAAAMKGDFGTVKSLLDPKRHQPQMKDGYIHYNDGRIGYVNPLTNEMQWIIGGPKPGDPQINATQPSATQPGAAPPGQPPQPTSYPELGPGGVPSAPPAAAPPAGQPPPAAVPPPDVPVVSSAQLPPYQSVPSVPNAPPPVPPSLRNIGPSPGPATPQIPQIGAAPPPPPPPASIGQQIALGATPGGNKFGGNTFGGATPGGNRFGASANAPPPAVAAAPPPGPATVLPQHLPPFALPGADFGAPGIEGQPFSLVPPPPQQQGPMWGASSGYGPPGGDLGVAPPPPVRPVELPQYAGVPGMGMGTPPAPMPPPPPGVVPAGGPPPATMPPPPNMVAQAPGGAPVVTPQAPVVPPQGGGEPDRPTPVVGPAQNRPTAKFDGTGEVTGVSPGFKPPPPVATMAGYKEEVLKNVHPAIADKVRAIANYQEPAITIGSMGGGGPMARANAQVMALVRQYTGGQYEQREYKKREAVAKEYSPAGTTGRNMIAIDTVHAHIGELYDAVHAMKPGSGAQGVNQFVNAVSKQFGDPRVVSMETAKLAVAEELSRAFKGANVSDNDIAEWKGLLNSANTAEQWQSVIQRMHKLIEGREHAVKHAWTNNMGSPMKNDFISPENKAKSQYIKDNPLWKPDPKGQGGQTGGGGAAAPATGQGETHVGYTSDGRSIIKKADGSQVVR